MAERLREQNGDDRLLRRTVLFAVLVHAVLFLVQFPRSRADAEVAPPDREV